MKSKAQQELEFTLHQDRQQIKDNRGIHGILHRHRIHKKYANQNIQQNFVYSSSYIPNSPHNLHKNYSRVHKYRIKHHFKLKLAIKHINRGIINWLTTTKNSQQLQNYISRQSNKHTHHIHQLKSTTIPSNNFTPTFLPNKASHSISVQKSPIMSLPKQQQLITNQYGNKIHKHTFNILNFSKIIFSVLFILVCIIGINNKCNSIGHMAQKHKQIQAIDKFNEKPVLKANLKNSVKKKRNFIGTIAHSAKSQKKYRIAPSLIIAQAALESSWGKSKLYIQDHNAFGVKGKYYGHYAYFETQEDNGGTHSQLGMFKRYPDINACVRNHNKLLYQNYLVGIPKNDYIADANALQKNGYATDPHYAQKIMEVVQSNHLTRFD